MRVGKVRARVIQSEDEMMERGALDVDALYYESTDDRALDY